jgi:hypothetical protein
MDPETSVFSYFDHLTRLVAREDFIILFSILRQSSPSDIFFLPGFPAKNRARISHFPTHVTHLAHLILLDLVILIIFGESTNY